VKWVFHKTRPTSPTNMLVPPEDSEHQNANHRTPAPGCRTVYAVKRKKISIGRGLPTYLIDSGMISKKLIFCHLTQTHHSVKSHGGKNQLRASRGALSTKGLYSGDYHKSNRCILQMSEESFNHKLKFNTYNSLSSA